MLFYSRFFFNDTATPEIYTSLHTLSLPDALPIYEGRVVTARPGDRCGEIVRGYVAAAGKEIGPAGNPRRRLADEEQAFQIREVRRIHCAGGRAPGLRHNRVEQREIIGLQETRGADEQLETAMPERPGKPTG